MSIHFHLGCNRTIDVQVIFCEYFGTLIDRIPRAVKYTAQHVLRNRQLHATAREFDPRCFDIYARCPLKNLDDGLLALDLKHLSATLRSIRQCQMNNFIVGRKLWVVVSDDAYALMQITMCTLTLSSTTRGL